MICSPLDRWGCCDGIDALDAAHIVVDRSKIAKLRDQGLSLREIAAKTGKSTMTVQRALKAIS
jgi:uncharacterized protein YerC